MPSKSKRTDEGIYYRVPVKKEDEDEPPTEEILFFRKVKSARRPRLELTPEGAEYIADLIAVGCTTDDIADELGVSKSTLYAEHNREFLDYAKNKGSSKFRNSLRRMQFEKAEKGDTGMLIWMGKQYLGQSDRPTIEEVPVSPIPEFVDELLEGLDL